MMIARSIVNGVGHAPERDDICIADSFEHPNRCDWRCSHDREWCIRRVRPMRYKGCHQAHNAQVVICALFTTRNSLKLQGWRKAFSPIRKVRAISQKLYSHSGPTAVKSPIASDAAPRPTSRGFIPWRFAYAGPGVCRATIMGPASANLHKRRHCACRRGPPSRSVECAITQEKARIRLGSALRPEWCGSFTLESLSASILVSQSLMKSTKKIKDPTNARMVQEVYLKARSSCVQCNAEMGPSSIACHSI